MPKRFVLYFHSGNSGDYQVLPEVFRWLRKEKIDVIPLLSMAEALVDHKLETLPSRACSITFDDGMDMDYVDVVHPTHGHQPSFASIMKQAVREAQDAGEDWAIHATSFVIASPVARALIQEREMLGYPWMSDRWWNLAISSGQFHIGSHSWDHVNRSLDTVAQRNQIKGDFAAIDCYEDADVQIRKAREMIERIASNAGTCLFAYPYGQRSPYLVDEYFPNFKAEHKTLAAFTGDPEPITASTNRWEIPRYGFDDAWRDLDDLARIAN